MAAIDFKEIPCANTGDGEQDTFELFARDFVSEVLGLKILSQPNRGADGGKDFLAEEIQSGTVGETCVRWLISCKHNAHSGKSVSESDEQNIFDRVRQHDAQGFMGFYSTIASSGLGNRLDSFSNDFSVIIFDGRAIEKRLLESKKTTLIKRYFPISFERWERSNAKPALLLSEYQPLPCAVCGKDLLHHDADGLILFVMKSGSMVIENVVAVCRGACDRKYESYLKGTGRISGWEEIRDFAIPTIYLKKQMALINNLYYKARESFTSAGIESYKEILIAISQLVMRNRTDEEWKRVLDLSALPEGL